jgi:hypothetical protein
MKNQKTNTGSKNFNSFAEFYPFYLSEHRHPLNRLAHFIGSSLALALILVAITGKPMALAAAFLMGYAFAWVGHYLIEKNTPATFKHPVYSFMGDWKMFYELLLRKRTFTQR